MPILPTTRLAPLAVTALLAGCGASSVVPAAGAAPTDVPTPGSTPVAVTDAGSARARWQHTGPDDYAFTVRYSCFCLIEGAWRVEVEDGKVVGARSLDDHGHAGPGPNPYVRPVAGLLAQAVRAEAGEAATVDAEYDPVTGLPTRVSIDWIANAVDDEISWEITAFRAR